MDEDLGPNGHGPQWSTRLPIANFNSVSRDSESTQVPLYSQIMDEDLGPNRHGPRWQTVIPSVKFKSTIQDYDLGFDVHFQII